MNKKSTAEQTFGQAIEALKNGKMATRSGWNGKGLFVFMQIPSQIDGSIIPKMQSLPDSVKEEFLTRINEDLSIKSIKYSNQLALVSLENNITGWSPSTSDTLATDWIILD